MNRRGFLGLFAAAPLAPMAAAAVPVRWYASGGFVSRNDILSGFPGSDPIGEFMVRMGMGCPQIRLLRDIKEPARNLPLHQLLGIERRKLRADHIAERVQPASLHSHLENAGGQVPRGDRVDDEGQLASVAGAQAEAHSGIHGDWSEGLDLWQRRPFDLCDFLRPFVKRALPGVNHALIENGCRHVSAPQVGIEVQMLAENGPASFDIARGSARILAAGRAS